MGVANVCLGRKMGPHLELLRIYLRQGNSKKKKKKKLVET